MMLATVLAAVLQPVAAGACEAPVSICEHGGVRDFPLIRAGQPAAVFIAVDADPALAHVATAFAEDLQRVSGRSAQRPHALADVRGPVVIITESGSALSKALVAAGKVDAAVLPDQWEGYLQQVVHSPLPGIAQALLVIGADRRGAVFGTFDLSRRIGVSPWHWFADVPVERRDTVFITDGVRTDQPAVKYRGFFINDEEPAFGSWARQRFGGINADAYQPVFELLLRLKGNLLWPAMWRPKAFFDDDPRNMALADAMGVVIATTHHEPMMRAHDEWHRPEGGGSRGERWDYLSNAAGLREFWRGGIQRMLSNGGRGHESLVTLGMRGDGDESMAGAKTADARALLERIVADQRQIIAQVTGRPAEDTPQVWALYKEVQDYYDQGMQVPDDVTLLFADDNWGQIRRLPTDATPRSGGAGVYYHFDYVGGPRNYKWLNTTQIEKTWQQMDLAYERGARALWMVNVGDIKPMEFPLSFFMDHAWQPPALGLAALQRYPASWAAEVFGDEQALTIGTLLTRYSQLAARRKPELIDAGSFRLGGVDAQVLDGGEFAAILAEWEQLEEKMLQVRQAVRPAQHSAFFQLVEHPIRAMATLHRLYYAVAWNQQLAATGDARANVFADLAEVAFAEDQQLTDDYHALEGGKWAGMMSQIHIGYTGWQQPSAQGMPVVQRIATSSLPRVRFKPSPSALSRRDVIAIEAPDYTRAAGGLAFTWRTIEHFGRTLGAMTAFPQGRGATTQADGVRLEYDVLLPSSGELLVQLYMVPTLDVDGRDGVRIGVSLDDGEMHTLVMALEPAPEAVVTPQQHAWTQAVIDNNHVLELRLPEVAAGRHVLKLWRLDDNAVVQKLVLATGELPPSYLGPAPRGSD